MSASYGVASGVSSVVWCWDCFGQPSSYDMDNKLCFPDSLQLQAAALNQCLFVDQLSTFACMGVGSPSGCDVGWMSHFG